MKQVLSAIVLFVGLLPPLQSQTQGDFAFHKKSKDTLWLDIEDGLSTLTLKSWQRDDVKEDTPVIVFVDGKMLAIMKREYYRLTTERWRLIQRKKRKIK